MALMTFWGLLGKATDPPADLVPLACRRATRALAIKADQNASLQIPHLQLLDRFAANSRN